MTKAEKIRQVLGSDSSFTDAEVARQLGVSRKAVYNVRKAMNGQKTGPTPIEIRETGRGHEVWVNGRAWRPFQKLEDAQAEAEFLRWPKANA